MIEMHFTTFLCTVIKHEIVYCLITADFFFSALVSNG